MKENEQSLRDILSVPDYQAYQETHLGEILEEEREREKG